MPVTLAPNYNTGLNYGSVWTASLKRLPHISQEPDGISRRILKKIELTTRRESRFRLTTSFWEATRLALDSLRKNKLRSFLTLLGIILATATLIAVTALIHGMNLYIAEKVSDMGADGFRIVRVAWFGPWDPKKFYQMLKRNPEIKPEEYEFIKQRAALLKDIGMMSSRRARISYRGESLAPVEVQGVTENIPEIGNVGVAIGRIISAEEVRRHATVGFIGNDLYRA